MRTRNIFTKLSFAIALVALAASGAVWEVRRVHAVQPPEPDRTVGMVGITRGQTIRLSLVNLAFVVDPQYPPDPCRATMEIYDNASGRTSIFAAGFAQPPPDPQRTQ